MSIILYPTNKSIVRLLLILYVCVCYHSVVHRKLDREMDLDSIYRRLLDVSIQLNRLLSDIKEHGDQPQYQTTMQFLQERRRAVLERHNREFEEERRRDLEKNLRKSFYRDLEDRQKEIANGTLAEDEIDGHSRSKHD